MNRRDFNTSLAALFAAPALPAAALSTPAPATLPPATYLWADLIARGRGHVDAGFLARRLNLTSNMAESLMSQMVQDGVLKSPGVTGIAKAANPMRFDAPVPKAANRIASELRSQVKKSVDDISETSLEVSAHDTSQADERNSQSGSGDPAEGAA